MCLASTGKKVCFLHDIEELYNLSEIFIEKTW